MHWRKRAKICRQQALANKLYENHPIGGVQVFNPETGEIEYLNSHPKTDWDKELSIANANIAEHVKKVNRANDIRKANMKR